MSGYFGSMYETDYFGPLFDNTDDTPIVPPVTVLGGRRITATPIVLGIVEGDRVRSMATVFIEEVIPEGGTLFIKDIKFRNTLDENVVPNSNPTWCMKKEDSGAVIETGNFGAALVASLVIKGNQLVLDDDEKNHLFLDQRVQRYFAYRRIKLTGLIDDGLYSDLPEVLEYVIKIAAISCEE